MQSANLHSEQAASKYEEQKAAMVHNLAQS